ncbi:hypothetical protein H0H87_005861 [Tephrocybe sp. NHM501043]|nr:hypothetical protein H0H87_005861 [Tephrocybe sp. NHM501043]
MPPSFFFTLALVVLHITLSSAVPIDNSGNAYSGQGGSARGGNVTTTHERGGLLGLLGLGTTLLNVDSGNAGEGGVAKSGNSIGMIPGVGRPNFGRWAGGGIGNSGNAYTQDGGDVDGGSVEGPNDSLINLHSNNAGSGGDASSGTAVGGGGFGGDKWQDGHEGGRDDDREDHHEDGNEDNRDSSHHEHHPGDEDCDC